MSVSIVMPCYNEEEIIESVVIDYCNEIIFSKVDDSEFIVIDDCSVDNTYKILERLKEKFSKLKVMKTSVNSGHGKAVRMGYENAQKEWIFQVDSDNQFEVKDFWKLYAYKDNYDFILGFRRIRHDSLGRLVLAKIIRFMNLILLGVWLKDVNCPFRMIKKEILDKLLGQVDEEAVAPNIMIAILAKKKRIEMVEVPITHYERKTGNVSIANLKLIKLALKGFRQLKALKKNIKQGCR